MRPDDILDSLGEIDDSLLLQAEMPIRRRSYKGFISIAAAVILLVCVSAIPLALSRGDGPVDPPRIPPEINDTLMPSPDKESADGPDSFESVFDSDISYPDNPSSHPDQNESEPHEETSSNISSGIVVDPSEEESTEISGGESSYIESSDIESSDIESSDIESSEEDDPSTESSSGDTSGSMGDDVYDGPIYKGYGYLGGDQYEEFEEEPVNYLGTYGADISRYLDAAFLWTTTDDNRILPATDSSHYDWWLLLDEMGYNIYPIMSFKSTDNEKDLAIYKHNTKDEYILRNGRYLYRISRSRVSYIRNLINYHDGP